MELSTLIRVLETEFERASCYRETNARWLRSRCKCRRTLPHTAAFIAAVIAAA